MSDKTSEFIDVNIEELVPFSLLPQHQLYRDKRLEQLKDSIDKVGLIDAIIVRPILKGKEKGKYEIICGHNRTAAMKALNKETIRATVMSGLSDEEALRKFYDSNLNQQTFSDWSYSQKIEAVKYYVKLIEANSQQGKRTDKSKKKEGTTPKDTSVQNRQKSGDKPKSETTRDRMSRRLGIATATLGKYRSIIKLTDDTVKALANMLDDKKITFESAYRISKMKNDDVQVLIPIIMDSSNMKIELNKLKELCSKRGTETDPLLEREVEGILVPI